MDKIIIERTSRRVKQLRLDHKLTMEVLAEKLGVSKSTIAKWENGYIENMRQDNIMKLSELFNVSPTYIMGYEEEPDENDKVAARAYQINQAVNKVMSQEDEQANRFMNYYKQLNPEQKTIVDNLLAALVKKQ